MKSPFINETLICNYKLPSFIAWSMSTGIPPCNKVTTQKTQESIYCLNVSCIFSEITVKRWNEYSFIYKCLINDAQILGAW